MDLMEDYTHEDTSELDDVLDDAFFNRMNIIDEDDDYQGDSTTDDYFRSISDL